MSTIHLQYIQCLQRRVDTAMLPADDAILGFLKQLGDLRKTKKHLCPLVEKLESAFVDSSGSKCVYTADYKALVDHLLPDRQAPLPCIARVNGERMSWFIPCDDDSDLWRSVLSVYRVSDRLAGELLRLSNKPPFPAEWMEAMAVLAKGGKPLAPTLDRYATLVAKRWRKQVQRQKRRHRRRDDDPFYTTVYLSSSDSSSSCSSSSHDEDDDPPPPDMPG